MRGKETIPPPRSSAPPFAQGRQKGDCKPVEAKDLKLSSELKEQIAVVEYCELRGLPIVHIPNEGKRSVVAGAMLKRAGMRPGFPDLFLPRPCGKYHGLFIEMKYDKGKTSADQEWWLATLSREGYAVRVCHGFDEAVRCIEAYLRKGEKG